MIKIYLAVPTHSHTLTVETALTLLDMVQIAATRQVQVKVVFHSASIISHLRNTIVADFLATDCTHLLMLDADQGVDARVIYRMLDFDRPVVGMIYPRRNWAWHQCDLTQANTPQDMLAQGLRFVGAPLLDEKGQFQVMGDFARASSLGTGLMLIQREVFEMMQRKFPELHGQGFPEEDENLPRVANNWGFFNPLVKALDGVNAGEDVGFCHRWVACGGELWANVNHDSVHVGRYPFTGNLLSHLSSLGAQIDKN
jgi:hypothetical protein